MATSVLEHARGLYMEGILDGRPREAIAKHVGARYTQHSTGVPDGPEGFIEFFDDFIRRHPQREIEIVRGFEDGRYAFVHAAQSLDGGAARWVTMDFFDSDDEGRIVEHWDVIVPWVEASAGRPSPVGGPTEIRDLERTADNKETVRLMIQALLAPGGDPGRVEEFVAADYLEHDPEAPAGRDAFRSRLSSPESLRVRELVLLVGQGNFVSTLCRSTRGDQEFAQASLYRLADGRIVERWEAVEPVPPREEWANGGKF